MDPLYVGIDVGSRNNVAYLMRPDGSKYGSFSLQNNRGGAKLLTEKIVSAMGAMGLRDVVIGMESTSVYGDSLVYALREDGRLGQFRRKLHANADLEELASFVSEAGRGRFADPEATAKAIQAAAKGSYRLPKTVNDSVNQAMSVSIAAMRALESQIKTLDKAIEQQFEIIPNTLTSIPGIGKVYSAGIIAEIGDINRFQSQASVAKYAGLVWTQHQSGEFEAQHTQLIKSGNRFLRYYLLEAANSVRRCDSEFRRYYDLKFKEVNQFQHKRALALTARKLIRLVFRLLKDNRLYIPPEG